MNKKVKNILLDLLFVEKLAEGSIEMRLEDRLFYET